MPSRRDRQRLLQQQIQQATLKKTKSSLQTSAKYNDEASVNNNHGIKNINLSEAQKNCINVIKNNVITFIEGYAGTGKTLCALHYAVTEYLKDRSNNIIVIRTPVENNTDKIGFLPASLAEKCEPHFVSAKDALDLLLNKEKVEADLKNTKNQRIQFKIPNYALGVTFENATIIIDEAQMLQPLIMKLLLERIGNNSKLIILGDQSQIYNKDTARNGLKDALTKFFNHTVDENQTIIVQEPKYEDIGYFKFNIEDMQRSDIVKTVIRAYNKL